MRHALATALLTLAVNAYAQAAGTAKPVQTGTAAAAKAAAPTTPTRTAGGVPRTPWGHPDLQGVWDYWTFTPLERPAEYKDKPILSDVEHAALIKRLNGQAAALDSRAPAQGDPGGYSQEVWTERARPTALKQTSILIEPEDGKVPPMTPQAQQKDAVEKASGRQPVRMRSDGVADDNPEDRGLSERCLLGFSTGPPFQPGGYNNNVQIVQTKDYVLLHLEMNHDARIVPLDNRPHLPGHVKTWLGDSRARWEGDTLVVESTNFTPKMAAFSARRGAGGYEFGSAENVKLIERFRRVDAKTLEYEFTVNDPTTFTRPFTGRIPMSLSAEPIYEYACHEGNYGLLNILRGGRAEDARKAQSGGGPAR
ncbi:MAG: hypothetical protein FJW27_09745 [Acidimicrobiia bacterium]|nr:hypothetical protein [Acidimicrobiia bacterium]